MIIKTILIKNLYTNTIYKIYYVCDSSNFEKSGAAIKGIFNSFFIFSYNNYNLIIN